MSQSVCPGRKGSRKSNERPSRIKTRRVSNRYSMEGEEASTRASAKKLKIFSDAEIEIDASFGYRIVDFISIFAAISSVVKCKKCDSDVKFTETSNRGLGFKLKISCLNCEPIYAHSSPLTENKTYDINRRIVLAFRMLGIGLAGIKTFCGIMDLPKPVCHSFYDTIVSNIHAAVKKIWELSMKRAVEDEKQSSFEKVDDGLTVSGDGTWRKQGFSSLFNVTTIIGYYTGKVVDLLVKSSYCKVCEFWNKFEGTTEFEEWQENHKDECHANHQGSAKMEVDAAREIFGRSEELHGVKYTNYIGDGDSKTYKGIVDSKPYGDTGIKEKECIGHVQKRMGTHLRKVTKERKFLGGSGKLTAKLIDELTVFYGLAIKRNTDCCIKKMKNAIWATFFHKISTDKNPHHHLCPPGENSWCSWQKAKACGTLKNYYHKTPLRQVVQDAIKPVYEKLSDDNLLERCLGGFTQNNNESLKTMIWSLAPEVTSSDVKIVEIASWIASSIFNDGYTNILLIMQVLNLKIGPNAQRMCEKVDKRRVSTANVRAQEATKEARILKRAQQKESDDIFSLLGEE